MVVVQDSPPSFPPQKISLPRISIRKFQSLFRPILLSAENFVRLGLFLTPTFVLFFWYVFSPQFFPSRVPIHYSDGSLRSVSAKIWTHWLLGPERGRLIRVLIATQPAILVAYFFGAATIFLNFFFFVRKVGQKK